MTKIDAALKSVGSLAHKLRQVHVAALLPISPDAFLKYCDHPA